MLTLAGAVHASSACRCASHQPARAAPCQVPVCGFSSDPSEGPVYDRMDDDRMLSAFPSPRSKAEVNRFYVDLPGDVWEQGTLMALAKAASAPVFDETGRAAGGGWRKYEATAAEVSVLPPLGTYEFLASWRTQLVPILGLIALRYAAAATAWVLRKLGKEEKDEIQEMMREIGAHRAIEYNVSADGGRDTGVRYKDVAGVEHILAVVQEMLGMLIGDDRQGRWGWAGKTGCWS